MVCVKKNHPVYCTYKNMYKRKIVFIVQHVTSASTVNRLTYLVARAYDSNIDVDCCIPNNK